MTANWLLPALLIVPLAGAVVLLLAGRGAERWASWFGVVVQSAGLLLAIVALARFDVAEAGSMQLVVEARWIPELFVDFRLGVDGISLPLVALTSLLGWCAAVYTVRRVPERGSCARLCRSASAASGGHAGHLHGARSDRLLRLLRSGTGAHVVLDRLLGQR